MKKYNCKKNIDWKIDNQQPHKSIQMHVINYKIKVFIEK